MRPSRKQAEFLRHASFLPTPLARIVGTARLAAHGGISLSISRDVAEEFRDAFTVRLAEAGFDADNEATSEGRMLEDRIDHFLVLE